jgi:uncharacterized membrane protein YdbT with pleckstrin-like domain
VAFPEDALADEEEVVLHVRPHARAVVRPILVLALVLAAVIVAWVMLPDNDGGLIGVAVVAAIALVVGVKSGVRPLLAWRCTHYVITDERILVQDGVIARQRRDLPLNRINDHVMRQSPLDRVFGSGTLTIDSIGDQLAVLSSVPRAQRVQTLLYELIEADRERHLDDEDEDVADPELAADERG